VSGRFVYNFYVLDEDKAANPLPTSPLDYTEGLINKDTIDRIDAKERGALVARVPRYIKINIETNLENIESIESDQLTDEERQNLKRVRPGVTNYNVEGRVSNRYIAQTINSDTGVKDRLQREIYRAASFLVQNGDLLGFTSDVDVAMAINSITPPDIDASAILDALADTTGQGIDFVNQIKEKPYSKVDTRASLRYPVKYSAEGYRDTTSNLLQANPFSHYFLTDLLGNSSPPDLRNILLDSSVFPDFQSLSSEEIESLFPDIKAVLDPIERLAENESELANLQFPTIEHIGYVVEKLGQSPRGEFEQFSDFVSLNPNVSEFIDPNIKYGFTYYYRARQLYRIRLIQVGDTIDGGRIKYNTLTAYLASRTPTPAIVKAEETTPPLPPSTLIGNFIYKRGNGIRLDWARPSSPTRDIKKYQVFRRRSINEPFELIAQYDFSDPGYTMDRQQEVINERLITRLDAPRYYHVDPEFTRESSFIYCVASVDAHGFVSNYGTQMLYTFDRYNNKIVSKKLSQSGAPRSYPNYYVDPTELEEFGSDRLVEDVIKDSGHGTMRVYFDPTAYRYSNESDGTKGDPLVLSRRRGNYKFQIVNLDRQISKTLTIEIDGEKNLPGLL
jgi:hypothetical protein